MHSRFSCEKHVSKEVISNAATKPTSRIPTILTDPCLGAIIKAGDNIYYYIYRVGISL